MNTCKDYFPIHNSGDGANDGLERRIIHREPARDYWDFPLPDGVPFVR